MHYFRTLLTLLFLTGAFPSAAPGSDVAKPNCTFAGIRYFGATAQRGQVCFTLTPNGRAVREFAFTLANRRNCASGVSGFSVGNGKEGLGLVTGGSFALSGQSFNPDFGGQGRWSFRLAIRGSEASGVFSHSQGICGPGEVKWTAHRVARR